MKIDYIHSLYIVEDNDKSFYDSLDGLIIENKKSENCWHFDVKQNSYQPLREMNSQQENLWVGRYKNSTLLVSNTSNNDLFNLINKNPESLISMIVLKQCIEKQSNALFIHYSQKGYALVVFENQSKRLRVRLLGDNEVTEHLIAGEMNDIEKDLYQNTNDTLEFGYELLKHHVVKLLGSVEFFNEAIFNTEMSKIEIDIF